MYKLIRFYNQNRRKIWMTILIIVFIIGIIQLLNYLAKSNNKGKILTSATTADTKPIISDTNKIIPSVTSTIELNPSFALAN